MSLPMSDGLRAIVETCVFCPKLCRWACPVAEAEGRETVTPWGLMTLLDDVGRGAPLDAHAAQIWSHCTLCGRCQQVCKHDNDVPRAILDARTAAVEAGVSPPAWRVWSAEAPPPSKALAALPEGGPTVILAGRADDRRIAASLAVLAAAGWRDPARPHRGVRDSGHRALSVGRPVAFAAAVEAVADAVRGAETIICLDAEDAETLRFEYAERAVFATPAPRILHLVEAVDGRLEDRLDDLKPAIEGDVLYLDACRLGRGLGVVEPPRALLARAVGGAVREALTDGQDGGCCGAGAGLGVSDPAAARAVAVDAVAVEPDGDVPVVIAGACSAHLRAALAPRPVYAWAEIIAAALGAPAGGA